MSAGSRYAGRMKSPVIGFHLSLILVMLFFPRIVGAGTADAGLQPWIATETQRLQDACLADVSTWADWDGQRGARRRQLREMLGLDPWPPRLDLQTVVTGRLDRPDFSVEKLHFQSLPGLYVSANLYVPRGMTTPAPAVLYVCGHADPMQNGINCGNKARYQHHAAWFARHGYVCLVIDTVERGEIRGIHHGTYRYGMWWWNARGYTPAGVEAWNAIRAVDYLCSRGEVDANRIGITGRSGGGAYSWFAAALDERIKVVAPVAGITDLHNHVVDGIVGGHCDCMYFVNTYRWDQPLLAALVAPRPLLLANSDKDAIFPLDGVMRIHARVRQVYDLYGAADNLGLLITEGPHADTQDLQLPVFRWFNRHLRGEDRIIEHAARPEFDPTELKVLDDIPGDEINTTIHEHFVPLAEPAVAPASESEWQAMSTRWKEQLRRQVFAAWPAPDTNFQLKLLREETGNGLTSRTFRFSSQEKVPLDFHVIAPVPSLPNAPCHVWVVGEPEWPSMIPILKSLGTVTDPLHALETPAGTPDARHAQAIRRMLNAGEWVCVFAPRGVDRASIRDTHLRRKLMLLGLTLEGMRVWDIRRLVQLLPQLAPVRGRPLVLHASGRMAVNALYAAIFEKGIARLELSKVPGSHREGPDYLNVLKVWDVPRAMALAAENSTVALAGDRPERWQYPREVSHALGWDGSRLEFTPAEP